eukprot:g9795.t1
MAKVCKKVQHQPRLAIERHSGKLCFQVPAALLAATTDDLKKIFEHDDVFQPGHVPGWQLRGVWQKFAKRESCPVMPEDLALRGSKRCSGVVSADGSNVAAEDSHSNSATAPQLDRGDPSPDLITARGLLGLIREKVAGMIKGKRPKEARRTAQLFGLWLLEIFCLIATPEELKGFKFVKGVKFGERVDKNAMRNMIVDGHLRQPMRQGASL